MTQVKEKLDFTGMIIFCGVDVYTKNWRANVQDRVGSEVNVSCYASA